MLITEEILNYILFFLTGDKEAHRQIIYAKEKDLSKEELKKEGRKIIILASSFFDEGIYGTELTMPELPLCKWNGIPVLFGTGETEFIGEKVIIHADLVASAFFLMTRYEEIIDAENLDVHMRFKGEGSFQDCTGTLERPLIDEWGNSLVRLAEKSGIALNPVSRKSKIYLTHDVDTPWPKFSMYRMIRSMAHYWIKERQPTLWPLLNYLGFDINHLDTFDRMMKWDDSLKKALPGRVEDIYFVIGNGEKLPMTGNYIDDEQLPGFIKRLSSASRIGVHVSYEAGQANDSVRFREEIKNLEDKLGTEVTDSRNHYLLNRGCEGMRMLIENGIKEDFTMGYADRTGFRLGTSRPVKWIDPEKMKLTELVLHPLNIMECTCYSYMGYNQDEMLELIKKNIDTAFKNHGDFTLLFHNNAFASKKVSGIDLAHVYSETLKYLKNCYK